MAEDFDNDLDEDFAQEYEEEEERDPYLEISELKQKLSLLQKTKEAQRTRYKKEMHMIVNALIGKHKELQKENHFLQQQIQQLMGEDSDQEGFLSDLKTTIQDQKKEVSILKKMVQQYDGQDKLRRQEQAELDALRDLISEKDQFVRELENKNQEVLYQLEAKDGIIARISGQLANLEAEAYALNKRIQSSGGESDQNYLEERKQIAEMQTQIAELEEKKNHFEMLAREAHRIRKEETAAREAADAARETGSTVEATSPEGVEAASDEEYEEAMDMLLQELQENLSTYDEISTQFSKARV